MAVLFGLQCHSWLKLARVVKLKLPKYVGQNAAFSAGLKSAAPHDCVRSQTNKKCSAFECKLQFCDGLNVAAQRAFCMLQRSNQLSRGRGLRAPRVGRKSRLCVQFHPAGMILDIRAN